jgi:hypothetical protein
MSIKGRLERLERRATGKGGRCPDCPPITFVEVDETGAPLPGFAFPAPCPTCGGPHGCISFVEVVVQPNDLRGRQDGIDNS